MSNESLTLATPVPAYARLSVLWKVPELLMKGTQAMRDEHGFTLPQEPREPPAMYEIRWQSATLYNPYRRTVNSLASKPFNKSIKANIPDYIEYLRTDADRLSTPLERVIQKVIEDRINYGKGLLMIRMPVIPEDMTEKARLDANLRPYWARVPASSLIGWTYNEQGLLSSIRLRYTEEVPLIDDTTGVPLHVEEREVIEVWTLTDFQKYIKTQGETEGEKWMPMFEKPLINELGYIPLVVSGRLGDGPMLADLADLNLKHFRSRSDQDTILHYARVPLLFFSGWLKEDVETTVSVHNAFVNPNKDSKVSYIEVQGKGIEAGTDDLEHLEEQMLVMGADLLTLKPGNPTATAKVIDTTEKMSDLQAIVTDLEIDLIQAFKISAEYLNETLPDDFTIEISKDFGISLKQREELKLIYDSRKIGELSRPRFLHEVERRGVFSDDFDIDIEIELLNVEEGQPPVDPDA